MPRSVFAAVARSPFASTALIFSAKARDSRFDFENTTRRSARTTRDISDMTPITMTIILAKRPMWPHSSVRVNCMFGKRAS